MRRVLLWLLVLSLGVCGSAHGQLGDKVRDLLGGAPDSTKVESAAQCDSLQHVVALLEEELAAARAESEHKGLEIDDLRFQLYSGDSLRRLAIVRAIDSLRAIRPGAPLVLNGDTLFYLYANRGARKPEQRVRLTGDALEELGRRFDLKPDSMVVERTDIGSEIMYGDRVLLTLTEKDALWAQMDRDEYAQMCRARIVAELHVMKSQFSLWTLIKRILICLLVVVGQYFLIRLTNWLFRRFQKRASLRMVHRARPLKIQSYEVLRPAQMGRVVNWLVQALRWLVIGLQLIFTVPILFSVFPQTKDFAMTLLGYIWTPIRAILVGVVEYLPNLFTIIVIWYVVHKLVQLLRYLTNEIKNERLKISWFYPDWAAPTFQIVRFVLYAFMIAMVYPYLPGSDSGVFQGVSVFVGIMVSLGATSVIGNLIAGLIITYMRPFRKGDCVLLNDKLGVVVEKTGLVTRIQTPKNEIITVPNSAVMNSHTVNYTLSATELGLIVHTDVTVGYDAPWRTVKPLLIEAARRTAGVMEMPEPFVYVNAHDDFYVRYQLNAYIRDANKMGSIYSELRANVLDTFAEARIDLSSPHFYARTSASSYFDGYHGGMREGEDIFVHTPEKDKEQ